VQGIGIRAEAQWLKGVFMRNSLVCQDETTCGLI
jgi:hypothetical protein